MKTITTNVTDSNGFEIGQHIIHVLYNNLKQPEIIEHKGVRFYATGKISIEGNYELASSDDARLWVDKSCLNLLDD